ncbi:hypothetical protein GCM10025865_03120 [Paraoerskovia sediminicola]|uniref:Nucleoside-diphosphate-sugar epimerase n=1 Tax=Paraoerskovia sediminicola TaxID=1138587 RepID=A0ABN6XA11_9CELL|nr:hypothetical protein GCM10025865_03120 [Paraoerskovia sediminicola]
MHEAGSGGAAGPGAGPGTAGSWPASGIAVVGGGVVARALRAALGGGCVAVADAAAVIIAIPAGEFANGPRSDLLDAVNETLDELRSAGRDPHVVLISSAAVLGASAARDVMDDDAPPADPDGTGSVLDRLLEAERLVTSAGLGRLSILRPAMLAGPGVDTICTRHLEAPRLLVARGVTKDWQMLHVDDLVSAVATVLDRGLLGSVTVGAVHPDGSPDVVGQDEVAGLVGLRTIAVPVETAFGMADRLRRTGVVPSGSGDLAFVLFDWTVSSRRLLDAGWRPERSTADCLAEVAGSRPAGTTIGWRRVGSRDAAAVGAAGAAVAALATAVLVRRARR